MFNSGTLLIRLRPPWATDVEKNVAIPNVEVFDEIGLEKRPAYGFERAALPGEFSGLVRQARAWLSWREAHFDTKLASKRGNAALPVLPKSLAIRPADIGERKWLRS